jgi:cysteinyl-tRNA synthetase
MLAGARVDVAPYKRDPMDFVLWKPSKRNEPGWPSPAGIGVPGRPGWHIECSAMSMAKLVEPFGGGLQCDDPALNTFDIHGGGVDLVFPHHENEIAQSCCVFGTKRMANFWMHNGFLQVEGEKMSKSLGNFVTIRDLLDTAIFGGRAWPGAVLRMAMLRTHYRQPIDWTVRALEETEKALERFVETIDFSSPPATAPSDELIAALADDLNMPAAIASLHALHAEARTRPEAAAQLRADAEFLGLDVKSLAARHGSEAPPERIAEIEQLVAERDEARRRRDWAASDRLRDALAALGVAVKDGKSGAAWEFKR